MRNINKLKVADTKKMTREEWLAYRKTGIGGSDASTIIGLNPWGSTYSLWAYKKGLTADREETEPMRVGRDLEEYVAQRFAEATGKKVRKINAILRNPEYPWALANIDRDIVGEDAGLECKTTSDYTIRQYGQDDFPDKYYCQCVHYMAVTGASTWYLAVLQLVSREVKIFTLHRDEAEIRALMAAESLFWDQVENGTPPPPDGSQASSEAVKEVFPEGSGDMELFGVDGTIDRLQKIKTEIDRLSKDKAEIENTLKARLGTREVGYSGRYVVTWKNQDRTSFDSKAFMADHPGNYSRYMKTTSARVLRIKETK